MLAKYSNWDRLHYVQNYDILLGWAQCISDIFHKMASAWAKLRLGKNKVGIVSPRYVGPMPR